MRNGSETPSLQILPPGASPPDDIAVRLLATGRGGLSVILGDEQRRLVDLLPGHDEAGVGDANVQPLAQDQLLVAKLGIAQELSGEITKSVLNFAQHSLTAITKPLTPYKTAYDDEYGIRCSFPMTNLFSKEK